MPVIDLKNTTIKILDGNKNELEVLVGEGNLSYSESKPRQYIKDRGRLSNVRDGDEEPVELNMSFTWEWLRSHGGEETTVEEALKQVGAAADWVTTGADACEPYCVDIVLENEGGCDAVLDEVITFSEFRYEKLDHDAKAGTVTVSGKCNEVMPTVVRTALA
jgi:hypothetical protein